MEFSLVSLVLFVFVYKNLVDVRVMIAGITTTFICLMLATSYYKYKDRVKLSVRALFDQFIYQNLALLLAAFTFIELGMDPLVVDEKLAALTAVYMAVLSYLTVFRAITREKSKRIRLALIFSLVITPIYTLIPYFIAGIKINM